MIKSAIVSRIIGAKVIAGFDKDSIREGLSALFYNHKINIPYEANAIDRNMAVICQTLGINYTKDEILNKEKFLYFNKENQLEKPYITLVVGASKENKIYPKERFVELVNQLKEKTIIVWGNDEEFEFATYIAQNSQYAFVAPKGNLDALKSTIANSKMVIGADTGPTHMAWALNIPSITIFGNTPEYRNTYITEKNKVIKVET